MSLNTVFHVLNAYQTFRVLLKMIVSISSPKYLVLVGSEWIFIKLII